MKRGITIGTGAVALVMAVLSARLGIPYLAYGVVATAILSVILCAWNRLDSKTMPVLVFLLGLAFLYQTTLMTNNLIGTDIHTEYFIYQQSLDGWNIDYPHAYNTAIGSTLIAPALTNWFGIPGYFIYKVIFPALFALVPMILFWVYRKEFGDNAAFLACIVFVTLPTYTLELIGLPRQMLGEIMLAVMMLLLVLRPIRARIRIPLLALCVILGFLFHYVTGPIMLLFIIGVTFILWCIHITRKRFASLPAVKISLVGLAIVIAFSSVAGFVYCSRVASGTISDNYTIVAFWLANRIDDTVHPEDNKQTPMVPPTALTDITPENNDDVIHDDAIHPENEDNGYFQKQEPLIRTALGLDFKDTTTAGKIFRVLQLIAQLFILLGCIWMLRNRRKVSAEYVALVITSLILLLECVLLPRFSNIINATRFYHIALFALSPLVIIGGLSLVRNLKVLSVLFLIPYILVMTGAVFEMARETDVSRITAPYSIALSNYRLGVTGEYSNDDKIVADWITESGIEPVLTDINGMLLLSQSKNPYEYINRSPKTGKFYTVYPLQEGGGDPGQYIEELHKGWGYLPEKVTDLPGGVYIFLTGRSMLTETVMFKPNWHAMTDTASGMRVAYPFSELGIDTSNVVFQSGDTVVIQTKEKNS